jgi:hypothetical protein
MVLDTIVRAAIHPAIGIARVGDSDTDYFIGPEVIDYHPVPEGGYKDAQGRLKRQAARFRIYGYNANNEVVSELTLDNKHVSIEWTVQVANTKSAWYNFEEALDIPEARPTSRRNSQFKGQEREKLKIKPSPRTISGIKTNEKGHEAQYYFNDGKFLDKPVYLGELRTDKAGRLLFLGGKGKSEAMGKGTVYTFANNDGWHDDTSDGSVNAKVKIKGQSIPVEPAWVVTAPPNYAPDLKGVVTLYDVISGAAIAGAWKIVPDKPSFTKDILPIFQRLCGIQWVNYGIFVHFGWQGPQDLLNPAYLSKLASSDDQYKELRRQIFLSFRNPDFSDAQVMAWPWFYGDGMNVPPDSNRQWLAIPPHLHNMLSKWADGNFQADWPPSSEPPKTLEEVPLKEQPETLDRAALEYCLGEAFHPGCEMTWPVRHVSMYYDAFRILPRAEGEPEVDYGDQLKPEQVFIAQTYTSKTVYQAGVPGGPLFSQGPGDLTRWMAVPWQTDTASCRSGYEYEYSRDQTTNDPYVPTFWPARVPNQVLKEDDYEVAIDPTKSPEERKRAFNRRHEWLDTLDPEAHNTTVEVRQMVTQFGKLGVVEQRPGVTDDIDLPKVMFVESPPGQVAPPKQLRTSEAETSISQEHLKEQALLKLPLTDKARRRPVSSRPYLAVLNIVLEQ